MAQQWPDHRIHTRRGRDHRLPNTVNEQCDGLSLSKSAEIVRSIAASAAGYMSRCVAWPTRWPTPSNDGIDECANELYMSGTRTAHPAPADLAPLFDALKNRSC